MVLEYMYEIASSNLCEASQIKIVACHETEVTNTIS